MIAMIRPARLDDVAILIQFIFELAEYERLSHTLDLNAHRLQEHVFGERPCIEALIAEVDSAPVGFALFLMSYSTFQCLPGIYLEDIFVRPTHRGNGLGRELFLEVAKLTVARKCGRMEWAVLDWNEPAIGFYRSLGATPLDDWTKFRLSDQALISAATIR